MVKLKRVNEAQQDLFSWKNPALDNSASKANIPKEDAPKKNKRVKSQRVGKTYIKRELPTQPYRIIDTFYSDGSGDNYWVCANCGRVIANIATVEGQENHEQYLVGMDCAATLSSISEQDIEEWSNGFKLANSIRNKIRTLKRGLGGNSTVSLWTDLGCDYIRISGSNIQKDGYLSQYFPENYSSTKRFSISSYFDDIKDFLKYCPDVAKQIVLNPTYKETSYTFKFLGNKSTTKDFLENTVTYDTNGYHFVLNRVTHHYYSTAVECELNMFKGSELYYRTRVEYQSSNAVNKWEGGDITYNPDNIYDKMNDLLNNAMWSSNLISMWDYIDGDKLIKNMIPM